MTAVVADLWRERDHIRRRTLASALLAGEIRVSRIPFGEGWDTRLEDYQCALCGGNFPPSGWASMWLDGNDGSPRYVHTGCWKESALWADLPSLFTSHETGEG